MAGRARDTDATSQAVARGAITGSSLQFAGLKRGFLLDGGYFYKGAGSRFVGLGLRQGFVTDPENQITVHGCGSDAAAKIIGNGLGCESAVRPLIPSHLRLRIKLRGFVCLDALAVAAVAIVAAESTFTEAGTSTQDAKVFRSIECRIDFAENRRSAHPASLRSDFVAHGLEPERKRIPQKNSWVSSGSGNLPSE
jgi:hypothetical protein